MHNFGNTLEQPAVGLPQTFRAVMEEEPNPPLHGLSVPANAHGSEHEVASSFLGESWTGFLHIGLHFVQTVADKQVWDIDVEHLRCRLDVIGL